MHAWRFGRGGFRTLIRERAIFFRYRLWVDRSVIDWTAAARATLATRCRHGAFGRSLCHVGGGVQSSWCGCGGRVRSAVVIRNSLPVGEFEFVGTDRSFLVTISEKQILTFVVLPRRRNAKAVCARKKIKCQKIPLFYNPWKSGSLVRSFVFPRPTWFYRLRLHRLFSRITKPEAWFLAKVSTTVTKRGRKWLTFEMRIFAFVERNIQPREQQQRPTQQQQQPLRSRPLQLHLQKQVNISRTHASVSLKICMIDLLTI